MAVDGVTETESVIVNTTVYIPVIITDLGELTCSPGSIPQLQSH